jgi:aspartyl-tRNA(Asn)/glutamyl-tRNA(Gln) amidotransferase subunit A
MTEQGNDRGFAKDPGRLADLVGRIAEKSLSPVDLVQQCLDRIAEVDSSVQAWRELDAKRALAVAEERAAEASQGRIRGPLHGIPVGIKDIIDVAGLPTRCNSKSREHAPPATADAEIVLQLKTQGAIVLGKTHTTEFAYFDPSPARNPWNIEHTPGGSSSGSGAAVGAGMVPLALGTQTTASLNRPAAYCGIAGFKPSTRSVPGFGVAPLASSYDTVGFYGGRVADAVYAFRAVQAPFIAPDASSVEKDVIEVVLLDDALIGDAEADSRAAWLAMATRIRDAGFAVTERASEVALEHVRQLHWQTQIYEMGRTQRALLDLEPGLVGRRLIKTLGDGLEVSDEDYLDMRGELDQTRSAFFSGLPANQFVLWPATPATAPHGLGSTGDPRYIAPWTGLGGPIVTIPAGRGANGLPLGCILCGRPGEDARLARVAERLAQICEDSAL